MKLYTRAGIAPPEPDETVFRISRWGPVLSCLIILLGLVAGIALFIHSYRSGITWGTVLSALYTLIVWSLCRVLSHVVVAAFSSAGWLMRLGPDGILLKFRSYLHADSPEQDPVALRLRWADISEAYLQRECYTTTDSDGKRQLRRWFLVLKLNPRYVDTAKVKSLLAFENQRRPAHFRVDDLKHELFIARKKKAPGAEIENIKKAIVLEKSRHPGRSRKMYFRDRPVVFVDPDQLRMEWTHITPGKRRLRQLLELRTRVAGDHQQQFDMEKPMTEKEFNSLLTTLLSRDESMEAVRLVKLQLGLDTTGARLFIEKLRR